MDSQIIETEDFETDSAYGLAETITRMIVEHKITADMTTYVEDRDGIVLGSLDLVRNTDHRGDEYFSFVIRPSED